MPLVSTNPLADALKRDFRDGWTDALNDLLATAVEFAAVSEEEDPPRWAQAAGHLRVRALLLLDLERDWADLGGPPPNLGGGSINHLYRWAIEYAQLEERGVMDPRPLFRAAEQYAIEHARFQAAERRARGDN
ncbi:MAG TPA: hypothetical protein VN692_09675 [Steroidobacteraceae bacterium]|nr:hypothetical protein [Steroidobacteraceae bacterium]